MNKAIASIVDAIADDLSFGEIGSRIEDKTVVIWRTNDWDATKHKNVKIGLSDDHATLLKWSPDSKAFVLKKFLENVVQVYRLNKKSDGRIKNAVKVLTYPKYHEDEIVGLGIASNGKYVVTCSEKTDLVVCDIKGALLARLDTYLMSTYYLCLSPCGRYVSACGFTPEARAWEVQFSRTGEFKQVVRAFDLKDHSSGIYQVAFSSDSSKVGTVSKDGSWRLFDINVELSKGEDPRLLAAGGYKQGEKASRLALSPYGDVVAVAGGSSLHLFFSDTAELDVTISDIFSGSITGVLFDSEGKFVLVSGNKHVRIFHNVTGHKATAKAAREKLNKPNNTSAMRERLQQQIADADALISALCH